MRNVQFPAVEAATSKTGRPCFVITLRGKADWYIEINRFYIDAKPV